MCLTGHNCQNRREQLQQWVFHPFFYFMQLTTKQNHTYVLQMEALLQNMGSPSTHHRLLSPLCFFILSLAPCQAILFASAPVCVLYIALCECGAAAIPESSPNLRMSMICGGTLSLYSSSRFVPSEDSSFVWDRLDTCEWQRQPLHGLQSNVLADAVIVWI